MTATNPQLFAKPISNGKTPVEGPRALPVQYDFSVQPSYQTDLTLIKQLGGFSIVQSLFIDNSEGNEPVVVKENVMGQSISVPAGSQGFFPILVASADVFTVSSIGSGAAQVIYINVPIAPQEWDALVSNPVVLNPQPVADAILDATVSGGRVKVSTLPTVAVVSDGSGTIAAGGAAQIALAANPNRQGYLIQNVDETNLEGLYYSLTGAAAIGTAGTFSLAASGGIGFPGGAAQGVGIEAISVIAATTGHQFSIIQW